jgi:hypothetical protein
LTWACKEHLFNTDEVPYKFNRRYDTGRRLYVVMHEMEDMARKSGKQIDRDRCFDIDVDDAISPSIVDVYDRWLHQQVFPPLRKAKVSELVVDGHAKVLVKSCGGKDPPRRVGRPRADGAKKRFGNGWLMAVDPRTARTLRILSISAMEAPENNQVAFEAVERVIRLYPNMDCIVYDRACKMLPAARQRPLLKQVKTFAVDKFHAQNHGATCRCSPLNVRRIRTRLRDVNTSAAEQVFSWFRGYAATLNSASSHHHRFLALYLCRKHNDLIASSGADHMNPHGNARKRKRATEPYGCGPCVVKRPAAATLKRPAAAA